MGDTIRHPERRTVTEDEHARLAWVFNNASDVHGDTHKMTAGQFGGPLVLGALTVAIVIGLARSAEWPADSKSGFRPPQWMSIRLLAPVFGGETLRAESYILDAVELEGGKGGWVTRRIVGSGAGGPVVAIEDRTAVPLRQSVVDNRWWAT